MSSGINEFIGSHLDACGVELWFIPQQADHDKGINRMPSKLLTVQESAEQLGLSARTIWAWIYERKLETVRLGRAVRIKQSALDQLIEQGTTPARANGRAAA
jgi:excisionase family DNA binding protein